MKIEYNDQVKELSPVKKVNIMLKLQDHEGVDDNGYSKNYKFTLKSFRFFHINSLKMVK